MVRKSVTFAPFILERTYVEVLQKVTRGWAVIRVGLAVTAPPPLTVSGTSVGIGLKQKPHVLAQLLFMNVGAV